MRESPLAKKLGLKSQQRLLLVNAPPGYAAGLDGPPPGVEITEDPHAPSDLVQVFAATQADLARYAPPALSAVMPGGALWVGFPKGDSKQQTDLTRDIGWAVLHDAGWERVRLISLDPLWSAWKFRPIHPGSSCRDARRAPS